MNLRPLAIALALAAPLACKPRAPRSPEALRDAYAAALRRDDADAAYALLAPELQATLSRDAFRQRWSEQRQAALADLEAVDDARRAAVLGGTTVHRGGAVLRWAEVAGAYQVVGGLPGLPDASTPAQAVRAFIAAVRAADLDRLGALLSDDLRAHMENDWHDRALLIEARLAEPGGLELAADGESAILRYAPGRALVLVQGDAGWRISVLE